MSGRIGYYGGIVKDGLILFLDAGKQDSYPRSGTNWYDLSGNDNNGTLINGPIFDSGNNGGIIFNGTNQYSQFSKLNPITGTSPFTICCYCKFINAGDYGCPVFIGLSSPGRGATIFKGTTNYICGGYSSSFVTTNVLANGSGVHYICLTYNGGSSTNIYIDGQYNITHTYTPNLDNTGIYVGVNNAFNRYFGGIIYNVSLYNIELTAEEVLQNYNATKSRFGL